MILGQCKEAGLKTEFVSLAGKKIHPCLGCLKCMEKKWCVIENDDWGSIAQKVLDCEVLVIGSPTYYYDVTGQLRISSTARTRSTMTAGFPGKRDCRCGQRLDGGGAGGGTIEEFLGAHEFASLGSVIGTGTNEGDIMKDAKAVAHAKKTGDKSSGCSSPGESGIGTRDQYP